MRVIETLWFTGMYGFCGIVLGEDGMTGEKKAFLGVHAGRDEGSDTRMIAEGGAKLLPEIAKKISDFLEGK